MSYMQAAKEGCSEALSRQWPQSCDLGLPLVWVRSAHIRPQACGPVVGCRRPRPARGLTPRVGSGSEEVSAPRAKGPSVSQPPLLGVPQNEAGVWMLALQQSLSL